MTQQPNMYTQYGQYGQYPQGTQGHVGAQGQTVPFYSAQPAFPQTVSPTMPPIPMPISTHVPVAANVPGMLPIEESYIENILRLNKGKLVSVHTTFENNREWNARIFNGVIEAAGRDHLILSDPQTGERNLIPMVYVDFITFQEKIDYHPLFGGTSLTSQSPR